MFDGGFLLLFGNVSTGGRLKNKNGVFRRPLLEI